MNAFFGPLMTGTITVICVLLVTLYLWIQYSFNYWKRRGVPTLPATFPFGNMRKFIRSQQNLGLQTREIYQELRAKYGREQPYGGFYMFTKPILMILNPDIIRTIFIKEFLKFPDRGAYYNEEADPLSANMFALGLHKWKKLRNKISPTFTSGKMKMMFETWVTVSENMRQLLQERLTTSDTVDLKDLLSRYTTDIIGSCVFGLDCNSMNDPDAEFRKYANKFINTTLSSPVLISVGLLMPNVLHALNVRLTDQELADFFMSILRDNIEYREKHSIRRKDFMDMFIRIKNNESIQDETLIPELQDKEVDKNETVTFNELSAQAFVFFVAGSETNSTASTLCMYELAKNPSIQEKLREDIKNTLQKHNNVISYESIMEMKYLDMVLNETLRKYPIAPDLLRMCRERYVLEVPGYDPLVIEPGTMLWLSILGIQTDPEYYPEPDKFDPERFSEKGKIGRHPQTYLPFGEGPRNCVGMRFALLQSKVAIVQFVKDHMITLPEGEEDMEFSKQGLLLFASCPIRVKVKKIA